MTLELVTLHRLDMTIAVMQGNAAGLDHLDDQMIQALENSDLFKELTDHNLAQIVADIQAYAGVLKEIREIMEANHGKLPDAELSIAQQVDKMAEGSKDIHQLGDREYPIELVGQGNNCTAIGLDSGFKSSLKDVFGGFDIFE